MTNHELLLRLFLRIIGTTSLCAVFAVVMPYSWMHDIHQWLGLGPLPAEPIVGYLARSISAFYALLGGLLWTLSFAPRRHRPVLCYLGAAFVCFGLMVFGIDWVEGLPRFWRLGEGPIVVAFGIVILWLSLRLKQDSEPQ